MTLEPEKEVYSLIKHDLANIYSCASQAVETSDYRDHWVKGYRDQMQPFINDLELVLDDLNYKKDERPDINPGKLDKLTEYDPNNFHEEFAGYVQKVNKLAELAEDCVTNFERSHDYEKGWVRVSDIFAPFNGDTEFNGNKDDIVRGDGSLACVINTLEDNANRHGGKNVDTYAEVNPGIYNLFNDHLIFSREDEYDESEDRWAKAETERDYKIFLWDDGKGLSDEFNSTEEIFQRGTGKNSGLGLPLSREIIEYFDGKMDVLTSHPEIPRNSGLIVSITLPGKKINTAKT